MKLATSYFGCRIPRHVKSDMRRLRRLGFDRVIHTFSENDLFYSRDTLRNIVAISKAEGLEVLLDPWGVAGIFGGEAFSEWIVENPDLAQRGASGRPLGGACLNHPDLLPLMHGWIEAAAATGADGVFWDEPHWVHPGPRNPGGEACVCPHCLGHLGVKRGKKPPAPALHRLRADSITRLLTALVAMASSHGLRSSVCLLPHAATIATEMDWSAVAAIPGVSEFGTDPYWHAFHVTGEQERDAFIDRHTRSAQEAARAAGIPVMIWVQAFRLPAEAQKDAIAGTRRLLTHEPDVVAIWGFEACAHMSELACGEAPRLWRRLVKTIRDHRDRTAPSARGGRPDSRRTVAESRDSRSRRAPRSPR